MKFEKMQAFFKLKKQTNLITFESAVDRMRNIWEVCSGLDFKNDYCYKRNRAT